MTASARRPVGRSASVARGAAYLVSGDLLNRGFRFGATILLARALTLQGFGIVNTAIAAGGLALMVTTFGLTDLGMREVALRKETAGGLALSVALGRMGFVFALGVVGLVATAVAAPEALSLTVPTLAMALALAGSVDWALRGLELTRAHGLAWASGGAVVFLGCVGVAVLGPGPSAAMWAFAAGEVTAAGGSWLVLRRHVESFRPSVALGPYLRKAWPLAISSIAIYIFTANADTLILTASRGAKEAGLYSAPYRVFWVLTAAIVLVSHAALPTLTRHVAAGNHARVPYAVGRLSSGLTGYGCIVLGISEVIGGTLLSVVFGPPFAAMGDTFSLLCIGLVWYAVGFPVGHSLIALDRFRGFLAGALVAVVVNLTLNVLLIPAYGAEGAAAATAVAFGTAALVWLAPGGVTGAAARPVALAALASLGLAVMLAGWLPGALVGVTTCAAGTLPCLRSAMYLVRYGRAADPNDG